MNKTVKLSLIASIGIAVTACSQSETEKSVDNVTDATKNAYERTKDSMSDGWDSIKDISFERKDNFAEAMAEMGSSVEKEFYQLKVNSEDLGDGVTEKMEAALDEFNESVSGLSTATADSWDNAKDKAEDAWISLKAAYADASS